MGIKVLDLAEGVVHLHTARDPADEGPLPGRIVGAHVAVFPHGLPDAEVSSGSEGKGRSHLLQACPLHGQPSDVASYPAYLHSASQSGHWTDFPWMHAGWWAHNMHLEARILPHWSQEYFSPWCTPMCFISLWWLGNSLSHTGHTVASLSTAGSWYGTSWASAPSGRSSPLRRADTCCFSLLRAHFLTTTSPSPTGVGVAQCGGPPLVA